MAVLQFSIIPSSFTFLNCHAEGRAGTRGRRPRRLGRDEDEAFKREAGQRRGEIDESASAEERMGAESRQL